MSSPKASTYSIALRIYHWANALTVILILFTVFVRKNWLEKFKIRELILSFAEKHNFNIDDQSALLLAKSIRNEIWDYHYTLGIILALLLLYRVVLLFFADGSRVFKEGFSVFKNKKAHQAGIKFLYIVIYIAIFLAIMTGLIMLYGDKMGINGDFIEGMKALHMGIVTLIIYFVPLHLIGLIMAELGNDKGIVSRMINGGKDKSK